MATLTALAPNSLAATAFSPASCAAGGDQVANDGRTILYFKNTDSSTVTVTLATGGTVQGIALADLAFTIAQNAEKIVGPFDRLLWNDANGYLQITYSAVTGMTVAAIRIPG